MWRLIHIVLHMRRGYSIERTAVLRAHNAGVEGSSPSLSTSIFSDLCLSCVPHNSWRESRKLRQV